MYLKNDLSYYLKNPKRIWDDISITEIKKGDKIDGFKVTKIKNASRMSRLGLKKGDVIIKANNIELKSYKDAFNIFNKINEIDTLQIVVMRNNTEKEFIYEIN
jgi:general secretion pathway protein C